MACSICVEDYSGKLKEAKCEYCNYSACITCWKRYLLESNNDPHCFNCNKVLTTKFLQNSFTKIWVRGELRNHRENILVDRQKAMLPETQRIHVEVRKRRDQIKDRRKIISDRLNEIHTEMFRLKQEDNWLYSRSLELQDNPTINVNYELRDEKTNIFELGDEKTSMVEEKIK